MTRFVLNTGTDSDMVAAEAPRLPSQAHKRRIRYRGWHYRFVQSRLFVRPLSRPAMRSPGHAVAHTYMPRDGWCARSRLVIRAPSARVTRGQSHPPRGIFFFSLVILKPLPNLVILAARTTCEVLPKICRELRSKSGLTYPGTSRTSVLSCRGRLVICMQTKGT
jgi:hypothetical protein